MTAEQAIKKAKKESSKNGNPIEYFEWNAEHTFMYAVYESADNMGNIIGVSKSGQIKRIKE